MKVFENINLLNLNSFGVDVRAARLVEWEHADQLVEIFGGGLITGRWMALGGGNNVLFTSDFDGTIVKSAARRIVVTGQTPEAVHVRAEAGVDWADFVDWCVGRGLWGVENLAGIPGTVGAAPIQNIGAYGAEVKDIIVSVECFCIPSHAPVTAATGANSLTTSSAATTAAEASAAAATATATATEAAAATATAAATEAATATAAAATTEAVTTAEASAGTEATAKATRSAGACPKASPPSPGGGNCLIIAAGHCGFGYRESVFKRALKGKVIITAVNFTLGKLPRPNLHYAALAQRVASIAREESTGTGRRMNVMEGVDTDPKTASDIDAGTLDGPTPEMISRAVIALRNSKLPDPKVTGNAGSFFKNPVVDGALARRLAALHPGMPLYPANPENGGGNGGGNGTTPETTPGKVKLSAAWLIEQSGWKSRKSADGRVGIHPDQALIITNLGGATGLEIVDFASRLQADVREEFGVELTPEVNII